MRSRYSTAGYNGNYTHIYVKLQQHLQIFFCAMKTTFIKMSDLTSVNIKQRILLFFILSCFISLLAIIQIIILLSFITVKKQIFYTTKNGGEYSIFLNLNNIINIKVQVFSNV